MQPLSSKELKVFVQIFTDSLVEMVEKGRGWRRREGGEKGRVEEEEGGQGGE